MATAVIGSHAVRRGGAAVWAAWALVMQDAARLARPRAGAERPGHGLARCRAARRRRPPPNDGVRHAAITACHSRPAAPPALLSLARDTPDAASPRPDARPDARPTPRRRPYALGTRPRESERSPAHCGAICKCMPRLPPWCMMAATWVGARRTQAGPVQGRGPQLQGTNQACRDAVRKPEALRRVVVAPGWQLWARPITMRRVEGASPHQPQMQLQRLLPSTIGKPTAGIILYTPVSRGESATAGDRGWVRKARRRGQPYAWRPVGGAPTRTGSAFPQSPSRTHMASLTQEAVLGNQLKVEPLVSGISIYAGCAYAFGRSLLACRDQLAWVWSAATRCQHPITWRPRQQPWPCRAWPARRPETCPCRQQSARGCPRRPCPRRPWPQSRRSAAARPSAPRVA